MTDSAAGTGVRRSLIVRWMAWCAAVALATNAVTIVAAGQSATSRPLSPSPAAPVALVVTFADGRVGAHNVGPAGSQFWTPLFPRIVDWRPADGEARAAALQCQYVPVGDDVRVDVSLLYGQPHSSEKAVATVTLTRGQRIQVGELRAFGVQPVTLSLVPVAPVVTETVAPPTVPLASQSLQVDNVEVLPGTVPTYRVTIRNVSQKGVRMFSVDTFYLKRLILEGRQAGHDGSLVIPSGGVYAFEIHNGEANLTRGGSAAVMPTPFDVIKIANVLWEDGSFNGDRQWAAREKAGDIGERLQVARAVRALTQASTDAVLDGAGALRNLRASIETLPIGEDASTIEELRVGAPILKSLPTSDINSMLRISEQKIKTSVLDDLTAFETPRAPQSPADVQGWLKKMSDRYGAWLERLSLRAAA